MKDEEKTKGQLIDELAKLRTRTAKLGAVNAELRRAKERLKEFERKYDSLVENSLDIMYILDPEGRKRQSVTKNIFSNIRFSPLPPAPMSVHAL